jgi:hypothetical protein
MWMKCWSQNLNHGWYSSHVPTICGLFKISYIQFGDGASLIGLHTTPLIFLCSICFAFM